MENEKKVLENKLTKISVSWSVKKTETNIDHN